MPIMEVCWDVVPPPTLCTGAARGTLLIGGWGRYLHSWSGHCKVRVSLFLPLLRQSAATCQLVFLIGSSEILSAGFAISDWGHGWFLGATPVVRFCSVALLALPAAAGGCCGVRLPPSFRLLTRSLPG